MQITEATSGWDVLGDAVLREMVREALLSKGGSHAGDGQEDVFVDYVAQSAAFVSSCGFIVSFLHIKLCFRSLELSQSGPPHRILN